MVLPISALIVSFMTFCSLIELFRILRLKSFGWGHQFFVFFVSVLKKLALEGFFCTFCLLFACTIPHFSECMGETTPPAAPPVDIWAEEAHSYYESRREFREAQAFYEETLSVPCSESSSSSGGGSDVPEGTIDPLGLIVLVLLGVCVLGVCYVSWGFCIDTFSQGGVAEDALKGLPEGSGKENPQPKKKL